MDPLGNKLYLCTCRVGRGPLSTLTLSLHPDTMLVPKGSPDYHILLYLGHLLERASSYRFLTRF